MPARRRTGSLHRWLLDGAPVRAPRAQTRHGPDACQQHRLLVRPASDVALRVRRRHLRAALAQRCCLPDGPARVRWDWLGAASVGTQISGGCTAR
jgi:hypothetical protein